MRRILASMAVIIVLSLTATGAPVDSNSLSCNVYNEHDIDVSTITYQDDTSNNGDTERYMSPGEEVTLQFSYNLPACDNAVDHSSHVIKFYNGDGDYLGEKVDLQMKQGNWGSFTTYQIPITIPEFNTTEIRVEVDVRANSVHGSDVWHEQNTEDAFDKVIVDTAEDKDRLNLEELPLSDETIQMLKNVETTSNVWGTCDSLPETVDNESYVDNPSLPGLRIDASNWNMDSGGGHPCYIFTAYQQALSLYNFYDVTDRTGSGDGQVGKAGTCGPNPNNQHNGGGSSLGNDRTFTRACPDYDGEWISADDSVACDDGSRKDAANHDNAIIEVQQNGETTTYASDGSEWHPVSETDTSQAVCEAFADAQGQGGWATGDIVAEEDGLSGARCNLDLTDDAFIVGQTLYEDGESVTCSGPAGVKRNVTIGGQTYYCRGVSE